MRTLTAFHRLKTAINHVSKDIIVRFKGKLKQRQKWNNILKYNNTI